MLLKESECVHADFMQHFFFHVCCSIHLRSWSPWQQHVCSVCARDTPLVLTQRHLLLWDVTGQKHEMQIVPTELPIVINRRLVT